jgi:hypothetical protein
MKRALLTVVIALLSVGSAVAQERAPDKPKPQPETASPRETGQPINIRVDLTISEQTGSAPATTKSISVLAADGNTGRIRSYNPIGGAKAGELNVDVRPRLLEGDRLQLSLIVEYRPVAQAVNEGALPGLSESLTVILQDGKPLVVSQSADPNSDRKVKLEARATILR